VYIYIYIGLNLIQLIKYRAQPGTAVNTVMNCNKDYFEKKSLISRLENQNVPSARKHFEESGSHECTQSLLVEKN
jgi:fumarate hydratase class II